ncbi:MAG: hypothetical protein ACHREM_06190 [Polyangiales bacterium]
MSGACTPKTTCSGTACVAPMGCCPGGCTNITTSVYACGPDCKACKPSEGCTAGVCAAATCTAPMLSCGGVCVNPNTDPNNCGGCKVITHDCVNGTPCANPPIPKTVPTVLQTTMKPFVVAHGTVVTQVGNGITTFPTTTSSATPTTLYDPTKLTGFTLQNYWATETGVYLYGSQSGTPATASIYKAAYTGGATPTLVGSGLPVGGMGFGDDAGSFVATGKGSSTGTIYRVTGGGAAGTTILDTFPTNSSSFGGPIAPIGFSDTDVFVGQSTGILDIPRGGATSGAMVPGVTSSVSFVAFSAPSIVYFGTSLQSVLPDGTGGVTYPDAETILGSAVASVQSIVVGGGSAFVSDNGGTTLQIPIVPACVGVQLYPIPYGGNLVNGFTFYGEGVDATNKLFVMAGAGLGSGSAGTSTTPFSVP